MCGEMCAHSIYGVAGSDASCATSCWAAVALFCYESGYGAMVYNHLTKCIEHVCNHGIGIEPVIAFVIVGDEFVVCRLLYPQKDVAL